MKKLMAMLAIVMISTMAATMTAKAEQANTYVFGVEDPDDVMWLLTPLPTFKEQGINNFYAFYSLNYDVDAMIKESSLKECEYGVNQNSYAKRTMVPQLADVQAYYDNIPEDENVQFWWRLDGAGFTCPAGNMTSVIGFKAPADGEYKLHAEFYGGAKDDQGNIADDADGITFAALYKDKALFSKDTGRELISVDEPFEVLNNEAMNLKKGEFVYFVADPNGNFANDLAHWYIAIEAKEAQSDTENTPAPVPEVTEKAEQPGTEEPTTKPTTEPTVEPTEEPTVEPTPTAEPDSSVPTPTVEATQDSEDDDSTTESPSLSPQVTTEAEGSKEVLSDAEEPDNDNNNSWVLWVILGVVVIGGAGAYVVIKRNELFKKK